MTIIKPGKKLDDVKFTCKFCGCEFIAIASEYSHEPTEDSSSILCSCHCPDCSELCYTTVQKVKTT